MNQNSENNLFRHWFCFQNIVPIVAEILIEIKYTFLSINVRNSNYLNV